MKQYGTHQVANVVIELCVCVCFQYNKVALSGVRSTPGYTH